MSEKNNFKFKRGRYPIKKKNLNFLIRNLKKFLDNKTVNNGSVPHVNKALS